MLCSSLFIGFIVILLKTTPQEAILPCNKHIKSWQKIKWISDLPTLIFFGMLVETWVFFRPYHLTLTTYHVLLICLCWVLTSQSTIFQSCRDGAIASWVINQYFWGVKCIAQGHNTAAVGFEPPTSRSQVRHSTTEPPRSPNVLLITYHLI